VPLRPCGRKGVADRTLFLRVASCLDASAVIHNSLAAQLCLFRQLVRQRLRAAVPLVLSSASSQCSSASIR